MSVTGSAHNWPLVGSLQCRQRLSRLWRMESLQGRWALCGRRVAGETWSAAACGVWGLEFRKGRIYFLEFLSGSFNAQVPTEPLLTWNWLLENKPFQSSGTKWSIKLLNKRSLVLLPSITQLFRPLCIAHNILHFRSMFKILFWRCSWGFSSHNTTKVKHL